MPQKNRESLQHSLFDADTYTKPQPALVHSDVADIGEEGLQADVEQGSLFALPVPSRRVVAAQASERINAADLTQTGMFSEAQVEAGEIRTFADCFVNLKPIVEVP